MKWLLIILLSILLFVFCIHALTTVTYDIGLHITLGKIALSEHKIVKTNYFSYTNQNFPWGNDYWISKVLLYLGYLYLGLKSLIIMKAIVITSAFVIAFFAFFRKETLFFSIFVGLISIFTLIGRTDIRPEMFSYLILSWYLFVLFRKPSSKLLWTLPFIQLFWVNTHIYFFLGPLIYLIFLFGQYVEQKTLPTSRQVIIGGLILLVNVVNPYGLIGALYPLEVFNNYGYVVTENSSPYKLLSLGYPFQLITYALTFGIFFGTITFLANYRNIRKNIFGLSLFILSAILAVVMLRNMPIFALCILPISIKNIYEAKWFIKYSRQRVIFFSIVLILLILSVIDGEFYVGANINQRFELRVPTYGDKAIDFVRKNHIEGPVFNNYDIGNYLIWQLPGEKVFIDGRPEAYPADFIENIYIPMQNNPEVFKKYSEHYNFNYIFWNTTDPTAPSRKFIKNLEQNPEWALVYKDGIFLIFVKNISKNQELFGK